jgi:hypothetical protein
MQSFSMRMAMTLAGLMLAGSATAVHATEAPLVKVLESAMDPTQETILVGRRPAGDMIIQFELEPAKAMWMAMGEPTQWTEHAPAPGEVYHVEVKPVDPHSNTRISYASVTFAAVNRDTGERVEGALHPMWGGSGLHYAMNSALAGDGTYEAVVTVGVPTFGRDSRNVELWREPTSAAFHFRLADGKLVEVSEPID